MSNMYADPDDPILLALARRRRGQQGGFITDYTEDALGPPAQPRAPLESPHLPARPAPERGTLENPFTDSMGPSARPPFEEEPSSPETGEPDPPERFVPPGDVFPEQPAPTPTLPPPEVPQGTIGGPEPRERESFGAVAQALANAGGFSPVRAARLGSMAKRGRQRAFPRQRTFRQRY